MTATEVTAEYLRQRPLPDPEEGDKKARGNVVVVAGGRDVPGAAVLAGMAALRAGAGRLQIATCLSNATALAMAVPEALVLGLPETPTGGIDPAAVARLMPLLESADAVLVGPGMQDEDAIADLTTAILQKGARGPAFVVDAGAIKNLYASRDLLKLHEGRIVITPHAGEMAGLMGIHRSEVESDPLRIARQAAVDLHAIVALKGARTFIVSSLEKPSVCREGNVGLATSGSGDVLAGVITGLLARGAPPFVAACWGVYLHAKAGDYLSETIGPLGFLARELLPEIPRIMGKLS
jgi:ADP-dependent NAD(P)H-hydrate dehydratase